MHFKEVRLKVTKWPKIYLLCAEKLADMELFLINCELSRQMQELVGCYIMLEEYFMHEMVSKVKSNGSLLH